MNMKRTIVLFLVMVLGLSLVACQGKENTDKKVNGSGSDQGHPSTNPQPDGRIGDGSTTFKFWRSINSRAAKVMDSHNEHPYYDILAEATGVRPKFINPPIGQEEQQLNLVLSSAKLPDAIHISLQKHYRGGVDAAVDDGIILKNMTELVQANAPHYMAIINADESVRKDSYTDDGNLISFGSIIPDPEMRGLSFFGPMVNAKYLEETGLNAPVTIADWEEMLIAFKENGVKIPLSWNAKNGLEGLWDAFSGAYGVPSGSTFFQTDGVVKYGPIEEGYKEYVMLMRDWYSKGLIDPDYVSRDLNKHIKPMLVSGELSATIGHLSYFNSLVKVAEADNKELVLKALPYPVLNEGDTVHFRHYVPNIKEEGTFITANAKDPLTIVKYVNFLYSEEGRELIYWGQEGITFNYKEDGSREFTDYINHNPDGISRPDANRQLLFRDLNTYWDWDDQQYMYSLPTQQDGWEQWMKADFAYALPTSMTPTLEEGEKTANVMSEVDTYVEEMVTKFIMGIEPMENYDKFIANIKKLGIVEVIGYQQSALDRYNKR